MDAHLLEIKNLRKTYPVKGGKKKIFGSGERMCAVNNVSFYIDEGETYGLVGESGCGKSTTGRILTGLTKADSGSVYYNGKDLCSLKERELKKMRGEVQMVFQNTLSALNPRCRIGSGMEEILFIHGVKDPVKRKERVLAILQKVGLSEEHYFRFPHELSGGQVQRLGIANALLIGPKLIFCDEPVSALDVSIQAQILNMLVSLKQELHISLLFVSHDIGVIRFISDRIGVMYMGMLVEETRTEELFSNPLHPYTKMLFSATLDPYIRKREFTQLRGEQTIRKEHASGCTFANRCPFAQEKCQKETPVFQEIRKGHKVACHFAETHMPEKPDCHGCERGLLMR